MKSDIWILVTDFDLIMKKLQGWQGWLKFTIKFNLYNSYSRAVCEWLTSTPAQSLLGVNTIDKQPFMARFRISRCLFLPEIELCPFEHDPCWHSLVESTYVHYELWSGVSFHGRIPHLLVWGKWETMDSGVYRYTARYIHMKHALLWFVMVWYMPNLLIFFHDYFTG